MVVLSEQDFVQYMLSEIGEPVERFEPFAFHNTDGDCIEFFISDRRYYGKRIDEFLTLYLDMETGDIVGSVIKNIQYLCKILTENCTSISIIVQDHKVQLQHLFQRKAETLEKESVENTLVAGVYRRLAEIAAEKQIEPVNILSV